VETFLRAVACPMGPKVAPRCRVVSEVAVVSEGPLSWGCARRLHFAFFFYGLPGSLEGIEYFTTKFQESCAARLA